MCGRFDTSHLTRLISMRESSERTHCRLCDRLGTTAIDPLRTYQPSLMLLPGRGGLTGESIRFALKMLGSSPGPRSSPFLGLVDMAAPDLFGHSAPL